MRTRRLRSRGLERLQVGLRHHGGRDRVGENLGFELVDLGQRQAGTLESGLESVAEGHQGRDGEIDDNERDQDVHEDAEQAVDPAYLLEAMEGTADRAADRAQDHGEDEGDENREHRIEMQVLEHCGRVPLVESEYRKQGAEEEDLGHQRLDHATLIPEDQRHNQDQHDHYVDNQGGAILVAGAEAPPEMADHVAMTPKLARES